MSEISDMSTISDMFEDWNSMRWVTRCLSTGQKGRAMPILKRLTALAGAAAAARTYARRNPQKVNNIATKAGQFIDKRTKGKYHHQINSATQKVRSLTGQHHPGTGPTRH
jgi:hypothetical protein